MTPESCPHCSAPLQIETRGELRDKVLACAHCDFVRDIQDEVTIHRKEGNREEIIHRRDLAPGEEYSVDWNKPEVQQVLKGLEIQWTGGGAQAMPEIVAGLRKQAAEAQLFDEGELHRVRRELLEMMGESPGSAELAESLDESLAQARASVMEMDAAAKATASQPKALARMRELFEARGDLPEGLEELLVRMGELDEEPEEADT